MLHTLPRPSTDAVGDAVFDDGEDAAVGELDAGRVDADPAGFLAPFQDPVVGDVAVADRASGRDPDRSLGPDRGLAAAQRHRFVVDQEPRVVADGHLLPTPPSDPRPPRRDRHLLAA